MPKKLNHTLNELMVLGALMSSFSGSTLVLADSINQHMESFKKLAQNIKIFYKNKGQKIAINQQTKINQNNPWITINSTESQFLLLPADNKTFVQYESGQTTVVPDIITLNHNKKHLYYKIQLEKGTNQLQLIGQKSDPIKGLLFNNKSQFNSQVNLGRYEPNNLSQTDQRLVKKLSSQQQTTLIKGNLNFKFPKLPQSITASLTQLQTSTAENSQNTSKTDSVKNNSTEKTDDHKSKTVKKPAAATKKSTIKKQPTAIIKKKIVKKITAKVQKNSQSNSPKKNTSQLSKSTKATTKKATKAVIKKNKSVQPKTKTAVKRSQPAKVYSVKRSLLPDVAVNPFKVQTKSASPLMAALALPDATPPSVTPSSGWYGTSEWSIDSSGVLTIGAGTFPDDDENSPWQGNPDITKIVITGPVTLGNDASYLFFTDENVQSIEGISNLDTSNVTNMNSMFYGDSGITSLDLSNFKTSKVTDMGYMFGADSSLTNLNVSSFDTSNVTNMNHMLGSDSSLTKLNVSSFDTSNVTNMNSMFNSDSSITSLDLSNFKTSKVTDMGYMFAGDSSLTNLNVSSFDTSKVTDMSFMFNNVSGITSLDLSNFNTSNVTNMSAMFAEDSSLTNLNVSSFDTRNVTNMLDMFMNVSSLISLDLSHFNTSNVANMGSMFYGDPSLTNLNVSSFDTSKVTDMSGMFARDSSLTNLNVSSFDTRNVTNMLDMFMNVSSLISLDLSNFNTSNVTNMNSMFMNVSSIISLDLSHFNTSNVANMGSMFYGDPSLTNLNVSSFDTSKVTDMSGMFARDSSLTNLNVSRFDTRNVTNMSYMFAGDSSLTNLDLSNWNMINASYESNMFYGLHSLSVLKLGPAVRFFKDSPSGLASPAGSTNWQEVGADSGGTISDPQGTVYSPSDLNSLLITGIPKDETFVPERGSFERKMTLSQTVLPTSIQKGKTASFTATMDNVSTLKQGYQDATLNFGTSSIGNQVRLLNSSIKDYDGNTVDPGNNLKYVASFTNAGVSGNSIQMTVLDANGNNASKYFSLNTAGNSVKDFQLTSSPDAPVGTYYIVTAYGNDKGNLQTSVGTINLINGWLDLTSDYNPAGNTSTGASNAAVQSGIESMTKNITPNKPDTTLQNVNFKETLPPGLTNVTNIKVNGSSTSLLTYNSSDNTISGNLGSLGNSDKNVVTFDATPNTTGNLTATANVTFGPSAADQVSANTTLNSYDIVDTDDQNISMPDRSNETNTLDLNTALNGKTFDFSSGSIYFEADKDDPGLSHQSNKVVGLDSSDIQVSYNGQFVGDDADDSTTLADGSNQKIEFNLTNSGKAKLLANNTVKFYLVMDDGNRAYKIPVVLSEPISTWMPDTNLQRAAYNGLIKQGKSIDRISTMQKTDINQLNDLTNTVDSAGDNKIKDLTGLEYANILTSIHLDGNDLGANQTNNEAIIAKLTTLGILNVSNNSLTGSLDPDWSNLKKLGLLQADNNRLSGKLPSSYSNLTNLTFLSAYNNQLSGTLTNDYFANMKGLKYVNLSNNQFTGQVPEFSYNDKLQSLNLNDNQLTGSLPDFSSSKQNLSSILVSNNQLTGALPDSWSNLPAISYIDVSNNQLTGTLPNSWIANMPDLRSLCLNNNTGLAIPLADWTNWTKLGILDLDSDKLSGSLPTSWGTNKPDLMDVHLGNGKGITGSIPDSWGNLSNLTVLDIGDNQISGNVPDSFCKLTNLMSFRYGRNHITSSLKGINSSGNYQTVKVDPSQWKREGDNLVLPYSAFYNGLTGSTVARYQNMGWKKMDASGVPYTLDNDKQEVVLNLKDYLKTWNAGKTVGIEFFIYDQNGSTAVNPTNMNYSSQIDAPVVLPTDFGSLNVNLSAHDSGANLKDGQFKIYDANGHEVTTDYNGHDIWKSTTNSSSDYGALQIYLPDGDYTVVETKAPDGYELSKKSYQVTIQSGQSVDVNVINDKQTGLPLAGSSIMPWIISGLVEIALIGAGWYLSKRRRKPEK